MLAFLIVVSIMAAVAYNDLKTVIKAGQKKLIVFYTVLMGLSFILAAIHCFGVIPGSAGIF